jgi:hypothetical protein
MLPSPALPGDPYIADVMTTPWGCQGPALPLTGAGCEAPSAPFWTLKLLGEGGERHAALPCASGRSLHCCLKLTEDWAIR